MADRILPRTGRPMIDRFWAKVDKNGPVHPVLGTRCWLWTACTNEHGYGVIAYPGPRIAHRNALAHRFAYEYHVGPIPDGKGVLHHCDNPPCVNYEEHLFPGTQRDNHLDMIAKGRTTYLFDGSIRASRTHCPHGHEYTPANTYISTAPDGGPGRQCRICRQAKTREWNARRAQSRARSRTT